MIKSFSNPKLFEYLALRLSLSNDCKITVTGSYKAPSAPKDSVSFIANVLTEFNSSELVLMGDLNWDWLTSASDGLKGICSELNISQLVNSPTCPTSKLPSKSTLLDLILTNNPHQFSSVGVFANDLSDHCVVACIRDTRLPKASPRTVSKINFKRFSEQAFLHDLHRGDLDRISLIPNVDTAWNYFHSVFLSITNKHAPFIKFRIKGRDNPWFSSELAELIHARNQAWAKARESNSSSLWSRFWCLRNKCTASIRKCKSEYYFNLTSENLNNPSKFWKTIKSLNPTATASLPQQIIHCSQPTTDKQSIVDLFNEHFISAGYLFDRLFPGLTSGVLSSPPTAVETPGSYGFAFEHVSTASVLKALKAIDPKKSSGPDGLDPYLLRLSAEVIAEPLANIFNLSLSTNLIPKSWKEAYVLPILKGGGSL